MKSNDDKMAQKDRDLILNALRMGVSLEDIAALVNKSVREMENMQVPLPVLYEYTQVVAEDCYARGVAEGIEKGDERLGKLITRLFAEGHTVDAERAAKDEKVRRYFYKKYGI